MGHFILTQTVNPPGTCSQWFTPVMGLMRGCAYEILGDDLYDHPAGKWQVTINIF